MNSKGRIGVIISELFDSLDLEMIEGIHSFAKSVGYDVLIFTDMCNKTEEYQIYPAVKSFTNIYNLAYHAKLDGILFYASRFLSPKQKEEIYSSLQKLEIPCLAVGEMTDKLPCVVFSQKESIRMLTEHMIKEHNCRKLYCLTGFPDEYNSTERLAGFYQAMEESGLAVDEDMIFYGHFWKEKPYQLGVDIALGLIDKPDAVICTSDTMAVSLWKGLTDNGVKIPDDIAITGYDGIWYTAFQSPKVTTACGREKQLGTYATSRLYEMITGEKSNSEVSPQYIRYGTTCGCRPLLTDSDATTEAFISNLLQQWENHKTYMPLNTISVLSNAESLESLMYTVLGFSYILDPIKEYAICLCDDWKFDFEKTSSFRTEGYSDRVTLALNVKKEGIDMGVPFDSSELLPMLSQPHQPKLIAFTSLHQNNQIFGYIATQYESPFHICLDEHFVNWCSAVSNGLDKLQNRIYNRYIRQQLAVLTVHDPTTGLFNKRGFMEKIPEYLGRPSNILLIAFQDKEETSGRNFISNETLIANALRLSATHEELIGRIENNVFAVLSVSAESEDEMLFFNRRITRLEAKIREILGTVTYSDFPELFTDINRIIFRKLSEAESFIEERLRLVLEQTEASYIISGNYTDKLYRLHREIWSEPQHDWNLPEMAEKVGVSMSHFQRIYKKEFGISCNKDIINARIEKAKWLLLHTDMRVHEVANASGYNDNSHFMRQFKEKVGMSALHYRNISEDNSEAFNE